MEGLRLLGRRTEALEDYILEDLGEGRCKVTFVNSTKHITLTEEEYAQEVEMSAMAGASALTKLKLQAEQGADAVAEVETEMERCAAANG